MTIPILLLSEISKAFQAGRQGKFDEGKNILQKCLANIDSYLLFMQPEEQMETLGCAANAYMECKEWANAASLLEQVCSYSEKLDPFVIETAGDYCSLGICRTSLGQWGNALSAFQRARDILRRIDGSEIYLEEVNQHIAELEHKEKPGDTNIDETTPDLLNILNRRKNKSG